jgi:hypothetical protein
MRHVEAVATPLDCEALPQAHLLPLLIATQDELQLTCASGGVVLENVLRVDDARQFELCALFASKSESSCLGFSSECVGDDFFDYGHDLVSFILKLHRDCEVVCAYTPGGPAASKADCPG